MSVLPGAQKEVQGTRSSLHGLVFSTSPWGWGRKMGMNLLVSFPERSSLIPPLLPKYWKAKENSWHFQKATWNVWNTYSLLVILHTPSVLQKTYLFGIISGCKTSLSLDLLNRQTAKRLPKVILLYTFCHSPWPTVHVRGRISTLETSPRSQHCSPSWVSR